MRWPRHDTEYSPRALLGQARARLAQYSRRQLVGAAVSCMLAIGVGLGALLAQAPHAGGKVPPAMAAANPPATHIPTRSPTPWPTAIPFARPEVQAGVAFPRWSTSAYGAQDTDWRTELVEMQRQTGARWVSIVVNLYQDTFQSTTIHAGSGTPTLDAFSEGITYAHSLGLHVFVEPLLTVVQSPNWDGLIYFSSSTQARAWFDGYWAAYAPYVRVAQEAGAEQLGIATELQALEQQWPNLWDTLISRVSGAFRGGLTYDINWNSLSLPIPSWLSNPALDAIGVSEYQPIAQAPQEMSATQIRSIWQTQLLPVLDHLATVTGKPVILSEIGYRNASDALYRPWDHTTSAPPDPSLQAAAYTAAAQAVFGDRNVVGLFVWAWNNDAFAPSAQAAAALKAQYLSPAA